MNSFKKNWMYKNNKVEDQGAEGQVMREKDTKEKRDKKKEMDIQDKQKTDK